MSKIDNIKHLNYPTNGNGQYNLFRFIKTQDIFLELFFLWATKVG